MTVKVFAPKNDPQTWKILVAAKLNGVTVETPEFNEAEVAKKSVLERSLLLRLLKVKFGEATPLQDMLLDKELTSSMVLTLMKLLKLNNGSNTVLNSISLLLSGFSQFSTSSQIMPMLFKRPRVTLERLLRTSTSTSLPRLSLLVKDYH
jgi:hypothetical protein